MLLLSLRAPRRRCAPLVPTKSAKRWAARRSAFLVMHRCACNECAHTLLHEDALTLITGSRLGRTCRCATVGGRTEGRRLLKLILHTRSLSHSRRLRPPSRVCHFKRCPHAFTSGTGVERLQAWGARQVRNAGAAGAGVAPRFCKRIAVARGARDGSHLAFAMPTTRSKRVVRTCAVRAPWRPRAERDNVLASLPQRECTGGTSGQSRRRPDRMCSLACACTGCVARCRACRECHARACGRPCSLTCTAAAAGIMGATRCTRDSVLCLLLLFCLRVLVAAAWSLSPTQSRRTTSHDL